MQKGNYGICLSFYAVLGLVLAFLGQTTLCALLLGFVILAEKDEWASRQVMQSFFLVLFTSTISRVLNLINIFGSIPVVGALFGTIFNVIESLISIAVLVFIIIALTRVVKGNDAGIPVLSKLAGRAFGLVERRVYTQAPPRAPQQPPVMPQQPQTPPQQPQTPPQNPQQ